MFETGLLALNLNRIENTNKPKQCVTTRTPAAKSHACFRREEGVREERGKTGEGQEDGTDTLP